MFSLTFQQNSGRRMDDLIVPAHTALTDVNRLDSKGCGYKELNVLTIKRIDEQLSPLPVFVY